MSDSAIEADKAEVIALLKTQGEAWATFVEGLSEAFLGESVMMPQGASPASRSQPRLWLSTKLARNARSEEMGMFTMPST